MPHALHNMEHPCYVYEIKVPCAVRSQPDISDDYIIPNKYVFQPGDLVSIDFIRDTEQEEDEGVLPPGVTHSSCGPFLRLSDGSGWMFERKFSEIVMERMKVESGLWTLYADNFPVGIGLRKHPKDDYHLGLLLGKRGSLLVVPEVTLFPMQKVVCDRKVKGENGVHYYRLEGSNGWVFDKRLRQEIVSEGSTITMLLPEDMIRKGLFAYRALRNIGIRNKCTVDAGSQIGWSKIVTKGDIVAVDYIRESPHFQTNGNGPFLHIADGSGFVFENKFHERIMEPVVMDEGMWQMRVVSKYGIMLRSQPTLNGGAFLENGLYLNGEVCHCDRRIISQSQASASTEERGSIITYYRVQGTNGWLFDKTDDNENVMVRASLSPEMISTTIYSDTSFEHSELTSTNAQNAEIIANINDLHNNALGDSEHESIQNRKMEELKRRKKIRSSFRGRPSTPGCGQHNVHPSIGDTSSITSNATSVLVLKKMKQEKQFTDEKLRVLRGEEKNSA